MSDLERRLSALEKGVADLSFVSRGVDLAWTPFAGKPAENDSPASPEAQLAELEQQWRGCTIVGQGVNVQGSMADGWAVEAAGDVGGGSLGGELSTDDEDPPAETPVYYTDIVFNDDGEPAGLNIIIDVTGWEAI